MKDQRKKDNAPKCPDCGGWARWEGWRCHACSIIHAKAYQQFHRVVGLMRQNAILRKRLEEREAKR